MKPELLPELHVRREKEKELSLNRQLSFNRQPETILDNFKYLEPQTSLQNLIP